MKVTLDTEGLTLAGLRDALGRRFPDGHLLVFGRTLMVSRGLLEGCGVVLGRGSVSVNPLPASVGSMLLFAALFALLVVPGCVYLAVLFVRSQSLVREVGDAIAGQAGRKEAGGGVGKRHRPSEGDRR